MASFVKPYDSSESEFGGIDAGTAAALLAVGGDIALVVDESGVVRDVSLPEGDTSFQASSSWIGRPWAESVSDDTRPKIDTLMREALTGGLSKRRQVNHSVGGQDIPVSYTALRLGRGGSVVAVGRDMRNVSVLQQRLVEAQQAMERDYWRLRHVETRYRLLFQLASDGILVLDGGNLRVLDANNASAQIFAQPTDKLIGRSFPFGVDSAGARAIEELLATARNAGRAGDITVTLEEGRRPFHVSASCFRQDASTLLLVRLSAADVAQARTESDSSLRLLDLLERSPDAFVVTDLRGEILVANRSFLDIAEVASEEQVRGAMFSDFIGRPGADFPVFLSMLRKHDAVRLIATAARGKHGTQTEVEVSAVWVPDGEEPCIGFTMRDIGRRLAGGVQGARDLTRAVEELTSLVGRVSLRDLVRDTIDLVERHFIEAALELTNDNRTSAAEVLGVSRQSLYVKLRRHRLVSPVSDRDDTPLS